MPQQIQSAAAKCAIWSACAFTKDGRAVARDIVTTGGMSRQPLEPIDKAQHVRHKYVGDGEGPG